MSPHRIYSNMSSVFAQLGDKDSALSAAKKAVEMSPNDFHAVRCTQTSDHASGLGFWP